MRSGRNGAVTGRASTGPSLLPAPALLAPLLVALLAGCSHLHGMHWPWHHAPPPPPAPVHELTVAGTGLDAAQVRQSWKRNTLVVDLSAASGTGTITLQPAAGSAWPVRLALKVTPGSIGVLEVRGEQHLTLPITQAAGKPVELELAPRLYNSKTALLTVSWGAASAAQP